MAARAFLAAVFSSAAAALAAQPAMTTADIPQPEDGFTYFISSFVPITESGPDAQWDFSTAEELMGPIQVFHVTPGATGFEAQFPTATIAEDDGTDFTFMRTDGEGLYIVGRRMVVSGVSLMVHYSDEQLVLPYPCTFNTAFTDSFEYDYTYQGQTATGTGDLQYTAEGFGTLLMPYGPVQNVLMLTGHYVVQESFGANSARSEVDHVVFYRPGISRFVAQTQYVTQFQNGTMTGSGGNLTYMAGDFFTSAGASAGLSIGLEAWPVPVRDVLNVQYGLGGGRRVHLRLVDNTGKVVREMEERTALPGIQRTALDVRDLPGGVYLLNIMDDHGQRGTCRVVVQ